MKPIVIVPTYNEAEASSPCSTRCCARHPPPTSWSWTTTAPTAPRGSSRPHPAVRPPVHLLSRPGKEGLGAAYRAGFGWALDAELRRRRPDGRRPLAPARAGPGAARLHWSTRTRDRLPLRAGGASQLAAVDAG